MEALDYRYETVRAAATPATELTTDYVAGTVLDRCGDENQLVLYVKFTKGNLTTAQVKVEFSHDNSVFEQETGSSVLGGTSTETVIEHSFAVSGNYRLAIPIKDSYILVSAKGTGDPTGSEMVISAALGQI